MATLTRKSQRPNRKSSNRPTIEPARIPEWMLNDQEAPDAGDCRSEAPESRIGRPTEAPDAGEGRMSLHEHEFTHGRSQG
jgi:hypothetical protein